MSGNEGRRGLPSLLTIFSSHKIATIFVFLAAIIAFLAAHFTAFRTALFASRLATRLAAFCSSIFTGEEATRFA